MFTTFTSHSPFAGQGHSLAMPKLKSILGKRPRYASHSISGPETIPPPRGFNVVSEGFAMGGQVEERQAPEQVSEPAYSGPRPYTRGSLGEARRLARSSAEACAEALVIEADAPGSRSSLKSQVKTWDQIARDAGFQEPFRLSPNLVFTVVGILKQAGYRSAVNYLEAAKRVHIESGYPFSIQLKHACRTASRSARRDLGSSKQAEALCLLAMATFKGTGRPLKGGPANPGQASLIAAWWLLREIEASHARVSHVVASREGLTISLKLPNSKTDFMALGTSRSHSCCCQVGDSRLCPYHALVRQVSFAKNLGTNFEGWLFPTHEGAKATKRGWSHTFTAIAEAQGLETTWNNGAPKYTGHSARASGAVHLALAKVDLWRIQLFGRWTSSAFLRYVRSAPLACLHELSLETAKVPALPPPAGSSASTDCASETSSLVQVSEEMMEEASPLPSVSEVAKEFVTNKSAKGKVHKVIAHSEDLHPRHWRSKCGWYFGRGMTSYDLHDFQPHGQICKICFSSRTPQGEDDSSSSSSSSSSSCEAHN